MVDTHHLPDAPPLRVFFTIDDDDHCTLQWLEVIESPAWDAVLPDEDLPF